ncbi:MAG: histidine kinase, partial [Kofleriaceae bacterium]
MATTPKQWLVATGLATWIVVGVPGWLQLGGPDGSLIAVVAHVAFGLAFWAATATSFRVGALAIQSTTALAACMTGRLALAPVLLVIVAGQAPTMLRPGAALAWATIQSLGLFAVAWRGLGAADAAFSIAPFVAFEMFAVAASHLAAREVDARHALEVANAELAVAHAGEAEAQRTTERLRLSRELHDRVGHHLTVLSLELELAIHTPLDRAHASVTRARALTSELLAEVRAVVSGLRETSAFDLGSALRTLAAGVVLPKIHVTLPDDTRVADPVVAHALFRCAQEAVTNAVRHAAARNLWLELGRGH